jgi:hypothetical protein
MKKNYYWYQPIHQDGVVTIGFRADYARLNNEGTHLISGDLQFSKGTISVNLVEHYYSDTYLGSCATVEEAFAMIEKRLMDAKHLHGELVI